MTSRLFVTGLLLTVCTWGQPSASYAQTAARRSQTYWYTVQNGAIVQKTGATSKPLKGEVKLPNGSRLQPLTSLITLASGEEVQLNQDDMVTASGEIIRVKSANEAPTPTSAPDPKPVASTSGAASPAKFTYVPVAPVNGKLKGVVELGASGFNSFIVRIDAQHNWKMEKSEFGNSLVLENIATDDDIRRGLKAYIGKMLDYGVNGRDIHFVVSSGAVAAAVTKNIIQNLKSIGYIVHTVTPEQEGTLGMRAAVPPAYADKAFLVDMGSANTKIAWQAQGKPAVVNTYGSKYFQQSLSDATVAADVTAKVSEVPAAQRQTCFIIGGVPYELAKAVRQGQEPYTVLHAPDSYGQLEGAKTRAGLAIYRALAAGTGCQQFVFGWDTNFTIGYLLMQP